MEVEGEAHGILLQKAVDEAPDFLSKKYSTSVNVTVTSYRVSRAGSSASCTMSAIISTFLKMVNQN